MPTRFISILALALLMALSVVQGVSAAPAFRPAPPEPTTPAREPVTGAQLYKSSGTVLVGTRISGAGPSSIRVFYQGEELVVQEMDYGNYLPTKVDSGVEFFTNGNGFIVVAALPHHAGDGAYIDGQMNYDFEAQ